MKSDFINTNIEVAELTMKQSSTGNVKYTILATDKKKYFFYQKNQGKDCDVFQVFNNMGVKKGSQIAIGFTEEDKSFQNPKGETINYVDRFIGSMREAQGVPQQAPPKVGNNEYMSPKEPNYDSIKANVQDAFGRRLAIHGLINGVLASGVKPIDIDQAFISQIDMLENRINEFLKGEIDSNSIPF